MAFVDDDEIECLGGDQGVVGNRFGRGLELIQRASVDLRIDVGTAENRVHPLHGRDADSAHPVNPGSGQVLDVENLSELPGGSGDVEPLELSLCLAAQVAPVYQKQD